MSERTIREKYFRWMTGVIGGGANYQKLLRKLFSTQFYPVIPMDDNRADDGVQLRYHYGRAAGISQHEVASSLDIFPCSILEMMVALAIRCEKHITEDEEVGDRTSRWFWEMVESLGLSYMTDDHFSDEECGIVLRAFLERDYARNGRGGLFTIEQPVGRDMRDVEIWYQMCRHLNEVL